MVNSKVNKEEVLREALELFRTFGFAGVSLNDISQKTGLEKSSLYFRFPGGKEEIVLCALEEVIRFFSEHVFLPLSGAGTPREKLQTAAEGLRSFYSDGTKPCVTESLSLPVESPEIAMTLKQIMHAWIDAFSKVAEESGLPPEEARYRAENAIISLEGALILSRVLKDPSSFRKALLDMPDLLLKA